MISDPTLSTPQGLLGLELYVMTPKESGGVVEDSDTDGCGDPGDGDDPGPGGGDPGDGDGDAGGWGDAPLVIRDTHTKRYE